MSNLNPLHSIAVFDSGVGGMSVVKALKKVLPHESLLYFADTASRPFGLKSEDELRSILKSNLKRILSYPIKALVIACHTACSSQSDLLDNLPIPVIKITPITLDLLKKKPSLESILILGTLKTINSGIFQNFLKTNLPNTSSYFINGSSLEKLIEEFSLDTTYILKEIQNILSPLKEIPIQKILLACTHFPIYQDIIQNEFSHKIEVVDPAIDFALHIAQILKTQNLLHPTYKTSPDQYFTTSNIEIFKKKSLYYFPTIFIDSSAEFHELSPFNTNFC